MKDILYTRRYTGQDGQERKEYITIGYMFEKEGRISLLMKPYINLGALQNEKGEVWLGIYEHKSKNTPKIEQKQAQVPQETTVGTISEVVNEGKAYAQKWKEIAENKPVEDDVPF